MDTTCTQRTLFKPWKTEPHLSLAAVCLPTKLHSNVVWDGGWV